MMADENTTPRDLSHSLSRIFCGQCSMLVDVVPFEIQSAIDT